MNNERRIVENYHNIIGFIHNEKQKIQELEHIKYENEVARLHELENDLKKQNYAHIIEYTRNIKLCQQYQNERKQRIKNFGRLHKG